MFSVWFVVTGTLLIGMALAGSVLKRLPLTAAMFYLTAGTLLGPWGAGLLQMDPPVSAWRSSSSVMFGHCGVA